MVTEEACVKTSFYQKEVEIGFCDCDPQHRVKPSVLCRIMADLAGVAFAARGMDHAMLWQKGYVFLLSRVSIRVARMPKADEIVTASTWERAIQRAEYLRDFEFHDQSGALLASGTTSWILVNPFIRQILRPSEFDGELLPMPEKQADAPPCARLRLRAEEAEEIDSRKIYYSLLDGNGHVYNAVYADLAVDALPYQLCGKPLLEMQLNFCQEAKLGDELQMFRQLDGQAGTALVKGIVHGKDCFLCRVVYGQ